jgi:hypothetical protein
MIPLPKAFIRVDWRPSAAGDSDLFGSCDTALAKQVPARRSIDRSGILFSLRFSSRLKIQVLGLAAAVILWGLGYKLSLYHHHPHPATVSVAKLWVDPRGSLAQSGVPAAGHLRAVLERASALQSIPPDSLPGFSFSGDSVITVSPGRRQGSGRLLNLLRSPPSRLS